ncbi:metaxin-1a [Rhinichthys klamathensis goyatoka]|uniref:metaxin-1a n=1 Tax=Rhinichthys klamathensis goyatoka TaxID=3034132 RepID=UPI0024B49F52|nr:metaxin-1a [Rhinichthys klamathensis goyatoka]
MAAPCELFCWKAGLGLPSVNTDCLIVLAYARFSGAPLKIHKISNPWRSPTGSLPALRTKEEGSCSQPSQIIIQLRKQKYNADYDLSAKEGADTLAFTSLLEERLLPALIYALWLDPKNYAEVTRRWYGENMCFPLNFFLPGRMQNRQLERLRLIRGNSALEAGEEAEKELYHDALECLNLLSQRLGSNKFFFGDSPSSLDAYVFGHLAPLIKIQLPNCRLQQNLKNLDNLNTYCSNILSLYFPNESKEGVSRPVSSTQQGGDFDNEPYKRRKQLLSVLVAVAAMLSYALLTGIVAIEHMQEEEHVGPASLRGPSHEDEEEE